MTPVGSIEVTCRPKIASGAGCLERALLDHELRAAFLALRRHLLGGLEDELHRPRELRAQPGEDRRHGHQDRDVRVVAAGVHDADRFAVPGRALLRCERQVCLLLDRKGVHVGAQRDDRAGQGTAQQADDTGHADFGTHLVEPEGAQMRSDDSRGPELAVAELGVGMDVAPPRDQLRLDGGDGGIDPGGERVDGRARGGTAAPGMVGDCVPARGRVWAWPGSGLCPRAITLRGIGGWGLRKGMRNLTALAAGMLFEW